jgi:hypothetical protein
MSTEQRCCPNDLPAVVSNYKSVGTFETLKLADGSEVKTYVIGKGNKKGILHFTDIFGYHPNAFQVRLNSRGSFYLLRLLIVISRLPTSLPRRVLVFLAHQKPVIPQPCSAFAFLR